MRIHNHIIFADPGQSGASLRRELKAHKLPKEFYSKGRKRTRKPIDRVFAKSEDDIRLSNIVEKEGHSVVDVIHTNTGILVRTKYIMTRTKKAIRTKFRRTK